MRIVIDGRMYGLEHAGIGRYVLNLINEIEKQDKKNKYFILLRKKYFRKLQFSSASRRTNFQKILADYPHYSFQEQVLLPLQLFKLKPDLTHFPHFNIPLFWRGKYVVTIHDLIKHKSRGVKTTTKFRFFYWFKYLNYLFLVWWGIKHATKVITPSQWWKRKLQKRYHLPPEKIVVTYEGVSSKFSPQNRFAHAGRAIFSKKPFVIYTGSLYPHKNVVRLVKAVKKINLKLVVVCARNIFWQRFKKEVEILKAEKLVTLTGFLPDEELVTLYQKAEAFVFPSLLEGFGLPGLEAMAAGLPVLASNSSCLPEVYGPAALYFNPLDVDEIAQSIKKIVNDRRLAARLRRLGLEQVKKYSWSKMARKTIEIYESGFGL